MFLQQAIPLQIMKETDAVCVFEKKCNLLPNDIHFGTRVVPKRLRKVRKSDDIRDHPGRPYCRSFQWVDLVEGDYSITDAAT